MMLSLLLALPSTLTVVISPPSSPVVASGISSPPPPAVPIPHHPPPPPIDECFESRGWGTTGDAFRGSVATTTSGRTCQQWSRQWPHTHTLVAGTPWGGELQANYCRNPLDFGVPLQRAPWCFTTDPEVRWELCDVCRAQRSLLPDAKPPHHHPPVPSWLGPLCLAFSASVFLVVFALVVQRACGVDCITPCTEVAFGQRSSNQNASASVVGAPRRRPKQPSSELAAAPSGGIYARRASAPPAQGVTAAPPQEGTFAVLAGLAGLHGGGGARHETRSTAGLSLLEHDSCAAPTLSAMPAATPAATTPAALPTPPNVDSNNEHSFV